MFYSPLRGLIPVIGRVMEKIIRYEG